MADRPDLSLPESLRPALAEPWGPVVDTATLAAMLRPDDLLITVGDVVSVTALELGLKPRLIVCDYHTMRGDSQDELRAKLSDVGEAVHVTNPAASVTGEAWDAIVDALQKQTTTRIVVDGEEDLLGIPCFLEAPDRAIVLYGMPGQGVVVCSVTPELRAKVGRLVEAMAA